jgi:hypothetical protein
MIYGGVQCPAFSFPVDTTLKTLYNTHMTTNLSIVKAVLDSNDSGNETVIDAQAAVISFFISRDGFRNPDLEMPPECLQALSTLKRFAKFPEEFPDETEVIDEGSAA